MFKAKGKKEKREILILIQAPFFAKNKQIWIWIIIKINQNQSIAGAI